ncbi:hypothetical protein ACWC10_36610 [Streptomyces sp. NPDC001595]|uniref:hypothetical protein n=1 Tax=Streptomyces sp. NPDC001532 TaxID=3154520 RepID=UPI00332ADD61
MGTTHARPAGPLLVVEHLDHSTGSTALFTFCAEGPAAEVAFTFCAGPGGAAPVTVDAQAETAFTFCAGPGGAAPATVGAQAAPAAGGSWI